MAKLIPVIETKSKQFEGRYKAVDEQSGQVISTGFLHVEVTQVDGQKTSSVLWFKEGTSP